MSRQRVIAPRRWLVGLALVLAGGCGAKTGLAVPDAGVDAPPDAPPDAPIDAGTDAGSPPLCIEVPPDGGTVTASLTIPVSLAVVDILFLLDATGSMSDEIGTIRNRLRERVVPGVRAAIPDAAFGVAFVGEFPERPYGPSGVRPYDLRSPITLDVLQVEGALEGAPSWGNFDQPEAQVEGLYQTATGDGLSPWIAPSSGCPSGGTGGACFRRDSLPVVMLATDAPFHNGPPGVSPEAPYSLTPAPHEYDETVDALVDLGALVIGLGARDLGSMSPMRHLRAISRDTGAVTEDGDPLAFDIGGGGGNIGSDIVEDRPGDDVDARDLIVGVVASEAEPPDGVESIEEERFVGVRPGTRVTFELSVDASALEPVGETLRVPARVIFRAFERSRIGREDVLIVIPGEDGGGCAED